MVTLVALLVCSNILTSLYWLFGTESPSEYYRPVVSIFCILPTRKWILRHFVPGRVISLGGFLVLTIIFLCKVFYFLTWWCGAPPRSFIADNTWKSKIRCICCLPIFLEDKLVFIQFQELSWNRWSGNLLIYLFK